jgi:hypothetical protein
MPNRLLFCGDRNWTDREPIAAYMRVLKDRPGSEICHGGARGADTIAGEEAAKRGIPVTVYRAEWAKYGKAAGPIRNRRMLNEFRPTQVVAFHANIETSKGTRDMVELAKAAGIAVVLHGAHGLVDHWCSCAICEADRKARLAL